MANITNLSLKNRFHLLIIALLLSCCWASAFPMTTVALKTIPVFWVVFGRLVCAAVFCNMLYIVYYKRLPVFWSKEALQQGFMLGIVGTVCPFLFITIGQQQVSSSLTALLTSTVPIFTIVLAYFFLKSRFTVAKILGCGLAMAGVSWVLLKDLGKNDMAFPYVLSVLAGTVCFAIVNVYGASQSNKISGLALATVLLNAAAAGILVMTPVMLLIDYPIPVLNTEEVLEIIPPIIGLGILPTTISSLLLFYVLKNSGELLAAVAGTMVPIFAILMSILFLGETISPEFLGAVLLIILGGLLVA